MKVTVKLASTPSVIAVIVAGVTENHVPSMPLSDNEIDVRISAPLFLMSMVLIVDVPCTIEKSAGGVTDSDGDEDEAAAPDAPADEDAVSVVDVLDEDEQLPSEHVPEHV